MVVSSGDGAGVAVGVGVSAGVVVSSGVAVDVAVWVGVPVGVDVGASVLSRRPCAGVSVRPPPLPTPVREREADGSSLAVLAGEDAGVDGVPGVGAGVVAGVDVTGEGVADVEVERGVVFAAGGSVSVGVEAVGEP